MEPIDYDRLIAAYQADLVDTLRGFGAQSELLELWVPDEDPVRSLCGMVNAAEAAGAAKLSVRVGPATAPTIDRQALLDALAEMGRADSCWWSAASVATMPPPRAKPRSKPKKWRWKPAAPSTTAS